jgi:hypothetical protein
MSPSGKVTQIPPDNGFPFHHFLGLAGLWWSNSNLPPHGDSYIIYKSTNYKIAETQKRKLKETRFKAAYASFLKY